MESTSSNDGNPNPDIEYIAEERALRQAIKEGVFGEIDISTNETIISTEESNAVDTIDADEQKDRLNKISSNKALAKRTLMLQMEKKEVPWIEFFDITISQPSPFSKLHGGNPLHVHDDLKREVAFYNGALEAVKNARKKSHEEKAPFSRPDDFFAEMVKTDEHMAKVKDRLIFESKKIAAFGQRKANKEQQLRSKELRSKKLQEKAKAKQNNLKAVETWAKTAASNRPSDGRVVDGEDNEYLRGGPNRKRENMNKKYGFGGKKGHFKQMDKKTINDLSNYNPYGNFGGVGTKKRSGVPQKRAGKRARDARKNKNS